ncbi:hypothetical protein QJS10_CPA07g00738 [Acorus calamus]|uniref:Uncharacterized protein n=1 Tax=Acorus calamus TaxID=4465 RepID=A0AAV9EI59_ACOCL|nr:hypothetical protein QJS10_CPA07g00738 [Acorus calamus]
MNTGRQTVMDLVEEAKKRAVLLLVCVFGLSYLMSLTSSSVWVNLPAAASLIVFLRYISLDIDMRRRTAVGDKKSSANDLSQKKSIVEVDYSHETPDWRRKVNSPAVEAAMDQFTRHLISEWVTDLWYSRITPDKAGPEVLVDTMNSVLGEIAFRSRDVNLIDFLTRDIVNLICSHLELYRFFQAKIKQHELRKLPIDLWDRQLKLVLAAENKLHPALFSADAEHKVLQHLMSGLMSLTFKEEDLRCSFFRRTVRELLACAVIRPVLNLANPRFINERIESVVLSRTQKADRAVTPLAQEATSVKPNGPTARIAGDYFSGIIDHTVGVELVPLKHNHSVNPSADHVQKSTYLLPRDPSYNFAKHSVGMNNTNSMPLNIASGTAGSSQNGSFLPSGTQAVDGRITSGQRSGEWGQMLDIMSKRKTQALAPEHFENMWTKGRNYKRKEGANRLEKQPVENVSEGISDVSACMSVSSNYQFPDAQDDRSERKVDSLQHKDQVVESPHNYTGKNGLHHLKAESYEGTLNQDLLQDDSELDSESSYSTDDDESNNVTGLDSPGTKVWDSKNTRNAIVSRIRHPLESSEVHPGKTNSKDLDCHRRTSRTRLARKRSRIGNQKLSTWQEVERTSFLLGDGRDVLNPSKGDVREDEFSDDTAVDDWGRIYSGVSASSSASCPHNSLESPINSVLSDSFLKLRCEVLGANIVKSGSGLFAVYSISVTDVNNNNWSIKRRFRHFEELHRRLKEFPEYNLSLPPKHFLSSGLDAPLIQERSKLLDKYLKKLLQLPTVSGSIEVWDFLSVDSQTYVFLDSLSIRQTLSVKLDEKPYEKSIKVQGSVDPAKDQSDIVREQIGSICKESSSKTKQNSESGNLKSKTKVAEPMTVSAKSDGSGKDFDDRPRMSGSSCNKSEKPVKVLVRDTESAEVPSQFLSEAATDPSIPTEWVPPNLSAPILDLVDVIFQLQDGGWIRRQAFWVAKQILQLGMGDAFDDWLIEKIQLLRKGSVIASAVERIEKILWPDGIFITKHPKRRRPPPTSSPKEGDPQKNDQKANNLLTPEQQLEADRRAKFVYELMIDNAPSALVGLVGRKEYEQGAHDLYFFLQSPVCMKHLAIELLELLLLSGFPELDDVVRQCHEEKEKFGVFEVT